MDKSVNVKKPMGFLRLPGGLVGRGITGILLGQGLIAQTLPVVGLRAAPSRSLPLPLRLAGGSRVRNEAVTPTGIKTSSVETIGPISTPMTQTSSCTSCLATAYIIPGQNGTYIGAMKCAMTLLDTIAGVEEYDLVLNTDADVGGDTTGSSGSIQFGVFGYCISAIETS